jgi:hypothetical protein
MPSCNHCNKIIRKNSKAVSCFKCKNRFHLPCAKISTAAYTMLQDIQNIYFICMGCSETLSASFSNTSSDIEVSKLSPRKTREALKIPKSVNPSPSTSSDETPNASVSNISSDTGASKLILQVDEEEAHSKFNNTNVRIDPVLMGSVEPNLSPRKPTEPLKIHNSSDTSPSSSHGEMSASSCGNSNDHKIREHNTDSLPSIPNPKPLHSSSSVENDCCLIAFNVPECTSSCLDERDSFDRRQFSEHCAHLGSHTIPITRAQRLHKNKDPQYSNLPRPLKITVENHSDLEMLLILQQADHSSCSNSIRFRTHIPRNIRNALSRPNSSADDRRSRSIIIRNVPGSESDNPSVQTLHDLRQWKFISTQTKLHNLTVVGVNRLPRPVRLMGSSTPRLLRVTFLTRSMAEHAIDEWKSVKHLLPAGIAYHADLPPAARAHSSPLKNLNLPSTH